MMKRLWEETTAIPRFNGLSGDVETDVLIIGGGMAGILCAHMLQKEGIDYILTEGNRIGCGTTGGTTAVLTAQHGTLYTKIVKTFGEEKARLYLQANLAAVEKFKELSESIPCDWEEKPSYVYSLNNRKEQEIEAAIVRELGFPAQFMTDIDLPIQIAGAVRFPEMAQFDPLKFLAGIAKPLNIRENTYIRKIKDTTAYSDRGKITAKAIIVATHYPFINRTGGYPLKLYQKRSFVVALENAPTFAGTYADTVSGGMYLRNYRDMLILGGGDCRTGTAGEKQPAPERDTGFEAVRRFASEKFPDAIEAYAWAAQDCMSLDNIPYIGRYSKSWEDVYVATGFNEWGMSTSMAAASLLCDMVREKETPYEELFTPDRSMWSRQLLLNTKETAKSFFTPTGRRCSHLGCVLKRNEDENSWDCSCHGSRFDAEGKVLENPAMRNVRHF
ncbi:MAG: FAD-dependent oxidoreductase [Bacillota bacterium]|nr:FAD-dependent oxidoreductase [Bacillota bacterium]